MYCIRDTTVFANVLMLKYLHIIATLKMLNNNLCYAMFHLEVDQSNDIQYFNEMQVLQQSIFRIETLIHTCVSFSFGTLYTIYLNYIMVIIIDFK